MTKSWDGDGKTGDPRDLVLMALHELRNSVMVIAEMSRTVDGRWDDTEPGDRREGVRAIARHGDRMGRLLEDLMVSARLDESTYPVAIRPVLVRDTLADFAWADLGVGGDLAIRVEPTLAVLADPIRLEQVVANLVANACRHGAPPVVIDGAAPDGARAAITVRDHGAGVAERDVPSLFEPFSSASRSRRDTGVGLHIARRLSRMMAGDLVYRPAVPGSAFVLTLPLAQTGASSVDPASGEA
jgi:signal transduction histidine kinase